MIKKIGILLLAIIAVVGLSSAVSAQPVTTYGPQGPNYGQYIGHGGHNTIIIINRYRHYYPSFFRFNYRHYYSPFYRFHYRNHFFPMYRR